MAAAKSRLPDVSTEQAKAVTDLLQLLGNRRRREVIRVLGDREVEWSDLKIISEAVTANIYGTDPEDLDRAEIESLRVTLYQEHIPRLEAAGIVDTRRRRNAIRRGPNFDQAAETARAVLDITLDGGTADGE